VALTFSEGFASPALNNDGSFSFWSEGFPVIASVALETIELGQWTPYYASRKYLCTGGIDLDSHSFRIGLFAANSNVADLALSAFGQLTNIVGSAQNAVVSWDTGVSAGQMKLALPAVDWPGAVTGIKWAATWDQTTGKLLCFNQIYNAATTIPAGVVLRLTQPDGLFTLT
jgi:hypothetical protein